MLKNREKISIGLCLYSISILFGISATSCGTRKTNNNSTGIKTRNYSSKLKTNPSQRAENRSIFANTMHFKQENIDFDIFTPSVSNLRLSYTLNSEFTVYRGQ